jgi:hypothetical protein
VGDTFASWLVQRGVSLFKVQQLLGHSTPMMIRKYAKLAPGAVADEAAEILDQLATERGGRSPDGDRGFESSSLQRGVSCEPDSLDQVVLGDSAVALQKSGKNSKDNPSFF